MLKKVMQRHETDCGVACASMITGKSYQAAMKAFMELGFDVKRGSKGPWMSNFADLRAVLECLSGKRPRMARWNGWDSFEGKAILKVRVPHTARDWHWVVATRDHVYGVVILDPESPHLTYQRRAPAGMPTGKSFEEYQPYGCFIPC